MALHKSRIIIIIIIIIIIMVNVNMSIRTAHQQVTVTNRVDIVKQPQQKRQ